MSGATLTTPSGGSVERFILDLQHVVSPTEGDAIYSAQRQRTRILDRTARGIDVDGTPFAPYSTNGPYYYYPNGRVGNAKFGAKQNKAAADRLIKKLGNSPRSTVMSAPKIGSLFGIDYAGEDIGYQKTRDGQGIKFASYAAFKAALARTGVDLRGPRAPHMLQAITIGVSFERSAADINLGLNDRANPVQEVVIGIYGDEAARASGHNEGIPGRLPQRRFLGANASDLDLMVEDIAGRIKGRVDLILRLKQ